MGGSIQLTIIVSLLAKKKNHKLITMHYLKATEKVVVVSL